MKKPLIYVLIILFIFTFFSFKKERSIKLETPPGTTQLDSNFFADTHEIRNVDYREYIYWLQRVCGKKSADYLNALPDTTVWNNEIIAPILKNSYFRHPMYQEYPVVGVSYKQAVNFCKWRSDRVNEMIMVREGELYWNMEQDTSNFFTIEHFLEGKCKTYQKNDSPQAKKYQFVTYSLPTEKEWNYLLKKSKELFEKRKISNRKLKKHPECVKDGKAQQSIFGKESVTYDKTGKIIIKPITSVYTSCFKQQFYHLQGNVSEITADKTLMGGSWKNSEKEILENKSVKYEKPTNFIGFRCVAKWKEYIIE